MLRNISKWLCTVIPFCMTFLIILCVQSSFPNETGDTPTTKSLIKHQMGMATAVHGLLASPDIRENYIFQDLKFRHGESAQVLRLLWWVREAEPELREELLTQWVLEKEIAPDEETIKHNLKKLIQCFTEENITIRMKEVEKVLSTIESERLNRSKSPIKTTSGPSGIEILDQLDESLLFDDNIEERKEVYNSFPPPHRRENGDIYASRLYILLWLMESDKDLRTLLLSRLQDSFPEVSLGFDYKTKRIKPLLENYKEENKQERQISIESLTIADWVRDRYSPSHYGRADWSHP